ncbi:MAG TPA: response regulator transcription factor [Candidatus Limnocylindria bacterium]|nr:response regulator transcription factor [Candidatus Limnocylindria bacterium]
MSDPIRVLIVDDERLFAELLRVAMRGADDIEVVGVAHDVRSALAALGDARPDVVLADYHMPDGTGADLARAVRHSFPHTAIVVLTGDPSAFTLADVARSGAAGHLTKERGFSDVVGAVRSAAAGEVLFSSSELQRLLLSERSGPATATEPLTPRELEVLYLLASGASTAAAASSLGISTATLRAHVQAVLRKLGAHSRLEAVAEAARLGLVTLDSWTRQGPSPRGGKELVRGA